MAKREFRADNNNDDKMIMITIITIIIITTKPLNNDVDLIMMFKISDQVIALLGKSMESWRAELTSGNNRLGEVNIRRGIFQGDTLSTLLFILALIPFKGPLVYFA